MIGANLYSSCIHTEIKNHHYKMSVWADLPVFIGAGLVSDWLTLKSCCQLDRACCSKGSRTAYLSYCAHTTCTEKIKLQNESIMRWYLTRKIRITLVQVSGDNMESPYFDQLIKANRSWISDLNGFPYNRIFAEVVKACKELLNLNS